MHIRSYTFFSTLHPGNLFLYAIGAPVMAMTVRNPVFLIISFLCALSVHGFFYGGRITWNGIKSVIPFFLLMTAFNFITNPRGSIVLIQTTNRGFTLESLCYGMANGLMLSAVIIWFRCFSAIVPNHKFLYLFGQKFQTAALLLSMILKLFPDTQYKMNCIRLAQMNPTGKKGVHEKISEGLRQISSLLEWSMEDSIEMADSMKARGYGSGKRTSYDRYSFTTLDWAAAIGMMSILIAFTGSVLFGKVEFSYYPVFSWKTDTSVWMFVVEMGYVGFLLLPIWMELIAKGGIRK